MGAEGFTFLYLTLKVGAEGTVSNFRSFEQQKAKREREVAELMAKPRLTAAQVHSQSKTSQVKTSQV